jgi:membrane-bound ClpP family serine protease
MILPFLLVFLGLILILLEFYVPGTIMGILGGISILTGILLFASQTSSLIAIILFVLGTAIAVGGLIRFAIWRIVHAKPQYSIYSDKDQEGYQASSYDKNAIGKTGIVIADLKPGGYILIEGRQHAAISVGGYIPKGEHVVVVGGQEQSLMVKLIKKEMTP